MKRFLIAISLLTGLLLPGRQAVAQLKQANEQYNLFNYSNAIELYKQAYKKDSSYAVTEHLANSYRLIQDYKNAETWYAKTTARPEVKAADFLRYAQVLQNNANYAEAKKQYVKYYAQSPDIDQAQLKVWLAACDSSIAWMKDPQPFDIKNEGGMNSPQSDWGTVKYNNTIIFASDRINKTAEKAAKSHSFLHIDVDGPIDKTRYLWTGNDYLRLYQTQVGGTADEASLFQFRTDGTDYHMSSVTFTAGGNEMYFTITRVPKRQIKDTAAIKTFRLEIFWSRRAAATGQWSKPMPFSYNNEQWSVGDPYITPNGQTLYFVSDMPGGKGGTDIYYCQRGAGDNWGQPINLAVLNTTGNERTPVLYKDNLYFSSDNGTGMGGLDIYKAERTGNGFTRAQNMGYPVNSPQDDFAFMPVTDTTGYLSSNRPGGFGSDDIYSYVQKPAPTYDFEGIVYDKKANEIIPNATITLTKSNGKVLTTQSDAAGNFKFTLEQKSNYTVRGEKKSYLSDNQTLTTLRVKQGVTIHKNLYLDKIELNKAIRLQIIYYDFDESYITDAAGNELDKLIKILKENPTIEIELSSHTDSRGGAAYNMDLSQRRAAAAVQYIVDIGGINPNRLKARGYGLTRLINGCKVGVQCTEEEHQLNRRTEFKITKM